MKRGYVGEDIPAFPIPSNTITERLSVNRPDEVIVPTETVMTAAAVAAASTAPAVTSHVTTSAAAAATTAVTHEVNQHSRALPTPTVSIPHVPVKVDSISVPDNVSTVAVTGDDTPDSPSGPLTFQGYAQKRSGNAMVGLQARFFVCSEDGVIYYYVSVSSF
jgi:hypothetical protein